MALKCILLLNLIVISLTSKSNGLTIKMIPIDSTSLNILPRNATIQDRHQFLTNISVSRSLSIQNHPSKLGPDSFKSPVNTFKAGYFVTEFGLGSDKGAMTANLLIDTGADDTWVQCQGCNPCFDVSTSFNYIDSTTFTQVGLTHELCVPQLVYVGVCGFDVNHGSARVRGLLGTDNFHVINTKTNETVIYKNVAFGCGLINEGGTLTPNNTIIGVLGLGPGPRSILSQLNAEIQGRFSYCLPPWTYTDKTPSSTMYFGDDAMISGDGNHPVQVISLAPNAKRYHLYLNAISVDGTRLPIEAFAFELDGKDYSKGFFIDSGTPYTMLVRAAYNPLRDAIAKHFRLRYGWNPVSNGEFDLCYGSYPVYPQQRFPIVSLLFAPLGDQDEVPMVLNPGNMFLKTGSGDGFCMAVLPINGPGPCIFGAFQQANFKILYDVNHWLLYFVPKNCLKVA